MNSVQSPLNLKTRCLNQLRNVFKIPLLEASLVRFTQGKNLGSWVSKLPPNNYQYRKPSIRKVQRGGINYQLDIADLVDWAIYFGMREGAQATLMGLIQPGAVILDVGANIGETVLNFSKRAGGTGRVYAFEPDPSSFENCSRNISLNEFKNIVLEPLALSHVAGESHLFRVSERNPGMNRILRDGHPDGTSVRIQTLSLDEYVQRKEIKQLNLIKIDVEGFELQVLKGAKNTISRFRPTLFIELDDRYLAQSGDSARLLVEFLSQWPYRITRADTGENVTADQSFADCHYDILCQIK